MKLTSYITAWAVVVISAFSHAPAATAAAHVYTAGHGDFGTVFRSGEWLIHYRLDTTSVVNGTQLSQEAELYPSEVILQLAESAKVTLPTPLGFLGAATGDNVWVIPQVQKPGVPFFGLATEALASSWGPTTFALTSFSGPGNFALWTTGSFGEANVKMQTNNGVDAAVDREILPFPTHAHYNWGFTQPGTYELGISVSSMHPEFGARSGTETIIVHVVPEPGSGELLAFGAVSLAMRRRR